MASGLSEELVELDDLSNLRLLTDALLQETFGEFAEEIRQFSDLADPALCPAAYLPYLAEALVAEYASEWPPGRQRLLIQSIVHLWHASGTHPAVRAIFSLHERTGWYAQELQKTQIYETHLYRWEAALNYDIWYKAARIDVLDEDRNPVSWDLDIREWVSRVIRNLCPIHVLVRTPVTMHGLADLSWPPTCDSGCEAGGETSADNVLMPTQVDAAAGMSASVAIETSCASACEVGCEASVCETGCELGACETGCEGLCETGCQGVCEVGCEVACTAACTIGCEAGCQVGCEGTCQIGCEVACETDCETAEE